MEADIACVQNRFVCIFRPTDRRYLTQSCKTFMPSFLALLSFSALMTPGQGPAPARLATALVSQAQDQNIAQSERDRLMAARLLEQGGELEAKGVADALPLALTKYEAALALFRGQKDPRGEATALNRIGEIHRLMGEKQK